MLADGNAVFTSVIRWRGRSDNAAGVGGLQLGDCAGGPVARPAVGKLSARARHLDEFAYGTGSGSGEGIEVCRR